MKNTPPIRLRNATFISISNFIFSIRLTKLVRGAVIKEVPTDDTHLAARSTLGADLNEGRNERFFLGQFGSNRADLTPARKRFMRSIALCALLLPLLLLPFVSAQAFTFDGKPLTQAWRTIATEHGDIQIDNSGDSTWDSVQLIKMVDLDYQKATAEVVEIDGGTELRIHGESAQFRVEQTMTVDPVKGRVVTRIILTPKTDQPEVPGFEVLNTGFNTNPRFDTMRSGEPVTGRMMDLPPQGELQFEEYFEAGPIKTDRAETGVPWMVKLVEVSDNLTLRAAGMPMQDYGLLNTSVWAEPAGVQWREGKPVTFEIVTSVTSEDEPRRRAVADARSVTTPRVWEFLAKDPPVQIGKWEVEMLPVDRHAPVFDGKETPTMQIRWRQADVEPPATATLSVNDAYSETEVLKIDDLKAERNDDGWYEARAVLEVPAGSVYDCYLKLSTPGGDAEKVRLGEVVRTGRIDQSLITEAPPKWVLVDTIDCTDPKPARAFYSASGESAIVKGAPGSYRVTGGPGDWFGYRIDVPSDARVMRIEVDYPDDAPRDVGVGVNEPLNPDAPGTTWGQLRTCTGYSSGLVFPVSNKMKTFEAIYFPNSPWATIEVINTASSKLSAPAAVSRIRVYQLEGELPQLPGYDKLPQRIFATWTEQGLIAGLSFNTDSTQRGGHSDQGFAQGQIEKKIPKEHFYRHWYRVIEQHARYLRYRGDTGYIFGAVMYNSSRYPSQYMPNRTGYPDPRYDPGALYASLFGDNGLSVLFNIELSADYRMFQSLYLTDYEVRHGATTDLAVSSQGRQFRMGGAQASPMLNFHGDLLTEIYSDFVRELAEYYGRYPGMAGVISLSGGIWTPMYFGKDLPLNDDAAAALAESSGMALPGRNDDPDRFAKRWQMIQGNGGDAWQTFRIELMRDFHKKVAGQLHTDWPDLQYVVTQYGSGYDAYIKQEIDRPLEFELKAGFDPRLYRDIAGVSFTRHFWGMYRALMQPEWVPILERTGPLGQVDSPATRFRDYYLNLELAQAFEGHARTSAFIHTQFREKWEMTQIDPKRPWLYVGIEPNIQYPQTVDTDMQFEFTLAYAQNTPDDLFYCWTDGAVQMGMEPRMQEIAMFLRALPLGTYENDRSVEPPVFVRRLAGGEADVFYAVNTSRELRRATVRVRTGGEVRDRVSGEIIPAKDGRVQIELEPFGLRAFEQLTSAPAE